MNSTLLALAAAALAAAAVSAEPVIVRVGPRRELKTLAAARDAVRARLAQGRPAGGLEVQLDAGRYELSEPLTLEAQDSGVAGRPVVWKPAPGAKVRISGGKRIWNWTPVTEQNVLERLDPGAREQLLVADLKAAGVGEQAPLQPRGFAMSVVTAHTELFYNNVPQRLARYPNEGFLRVKAVPGGQDGMTVTTDDPRLARWAGEPEPWVFGYWFHDWADAYQPVAGLDPATGTITLGGPKPNYGIRANQRFYLFNLLGELDAPGEWYIDRGAAKLYFWPPAPGGVAELSVADGLLRLNGASHLWFEGVTFEACRANAVEMRDCHDCRLVACTLRNAGNRAATVSGGTACGLVGCDVMDTGDGGVSLSGGDRRTLTPGGHFVVNCAMTRFSRWCRTYRPAVLLDGVGHTVAHCLLWDAPHSAIIQGGNEHRIEHNEIHSVCWETGDCGAFYMGRDWTARGTVLRGNFFHHIEGPGQYGAQGIYLDDAASGTTVVGNIFREVTMAMFIGGGRDNQVLGNVFVDCRPALHIDARAMGWMAAAVQPDGVLVQRLHAMPVTEEPWRSRYPKLLTILHDEPAAPKYNVIRGNLAVGGSWDHIEAKALPYQTIEDNHLALDRAMTDELDAQYRPRPDSPVWAWGFRAIPFRRIGLQRDMPRASWPVLAPVRPKTP